MSDGPKLVNDTTVEHPSDAGAEPRLDWANRLMHDLQEHVLQCALHYVRSRDEANEVAQAVLAQLWIVHGEKLLRYDEDALKEDLRIIVRRRFIDMRRRAKTREANEAELKEYLEDYLSARQRLPERDHDEQELREELGRAVSALSPASQDIYRLYLTGVPHKIIAERFEVTAGYAALAVVRAAARVRAKLAAWAPPSYVAKGDGVPRKPGRPRLRFFGKGRDA